MLTPNQYSQEEVVQIINEVLDGMVSRYAFGIYDRDDIKSEGFLLAVEKLNGYNPKEGPLENYLRSVLPNALKNFRRNRSYRAGLHCVRHKEFTKDCDGCEARQDRQNTKKNLLSPIDIDSVDVDGQSSLMCAADLNGLELKEMMTRINKDLPVNMRKDYLKMKEGLYVPRTRRVMIEDEIRRILE
jgi:DNA-directed RNA polymerase specialized sigma24 family protein